MYKVGRTVRNQVTILTCIGKFTDLNVGQNVNYSNWVFHGFPQTFQKIRALYLKLDCSQFLPIISSHATFNSV